MENIAPVGVSTYSRLSHFKRTIDTLKDNYLAEKSELYIFSDAPQKGDEKNVAEVRAYADTVSGFKKVHVIKREQNDRVFNNRGGMKKLLEEYGKVIFLEEDIVTSKYFLTFMNEALNKYRDEEKVLSISGYSPPIKIPKSYTQDVFLLKRFNAWGFGTWAHKFDPFSFTIDEREYALKIKEIMPDLEQYGSDIPHMVKKEVNGELDALDVKLMYYQVVNNLYTVYPVKSMTKNIGHDGSGLHCGTTVRFETDLAEKKLNFDKLTREYQDIVDEHRKFRNQTGRYFIDRIYHKIRSILHLN